MSAVFTVYIAAHSLVSDLNDPAGWERALTRLRGVHAGKVVLESYRGGLVIDEAVIAAARDRFRAEGFETIGGLMPVHGKTFGARAEGVETRMAFFCYSSEKTVADLEGEIRKLSRVFDQVVIDDAFMTSCRCAQCERARAGRDWGAFRRDLLCRVSERWMKAAHEENPKVALTVKFPQTYDRCHVYGYDAERFPGIYDTVWVGTETRNPSTPKYGFTEPYQGYFNARWMRACAGEKFEGAWFDYLDCDDQLFYDQAVATHLGAPKDIVMFCYGDALFSGGLTERVAAAAPALERLRHAAVAPRGVYVIKPALSEGDGDLFIYDYLGMMGIPCVPATRLSPDMRSVIVPAQGMDDPRAADSIRAIVSSGGQVAVTHAALCKMASNNPALLSLFGYTPANVSSARTVARAFEISGQRYEAAAPFHVAGDLAPDVDTDVTAMAMFGSWGEGDERVPFVTEKAHAGGGKAVVWNLGAFRHDAYSIEESLCIPVKVELLTLPEAVITFLRNGATAPLGFTFDLPPRVAAYLFAKDLVLVNYTSQPVAARIAGLTLDAASFFSDSAESGMTPEGPRIAAGSYVRMAVMP